MSRHPAERAQSHLIKRQSIIYANRCSELAREWLDPATPKERAEQMVLHQGESADVFEWFKVTKALCTSAIRGLI
jgi:hypothetical protein